ncbi:MAG TPA: prolyl oligopeptidase family serine peptidase [Acidimicrobiales bacterium]|nr:prolyl oligopeptidase family serine peptidase [Acidimicrobiales bacterium]
MAGSGPKSVARDRGASPASLASPAVDDPYLWLEEIEGDRSLAWVREMNARSEGELFADPRFPRLRQAILEVLEADDRIPMPGRHLDTALNFWTDSSHRRGVLRRMPWVDYLAGSDAWETVLDVDALSRDEGESWVVHGFTVRRPDRRRVLVELSPGGSDASVTRELDLVDKRFVPPEEGGFVRPLAKGWLVWIDDDTVYAGTDTGEGSLTSSGYPRTIRRWARGTALADAPVVFEGDHDDTSVFVSVGTLPGARHHLFGRHLDFYDAKRWILRDGELVAIDVPDSADVSVHGEWLLARPRTDWNDDGRTLPAGSLVAAPLAPFLAGDHRLRMVFEPSEVSALAGWTWTRDRLVLRVQEHVRDRLFTTSPDDGWALHELAGAPPEWTIDVMAVDADRLDDTFLVANDFLTPTTLLLAEPPAAPRVLRRAPARFDASGLAVEQRFASSADGTQVPYFLVGPRGHTGPRPTILAGYGGFEISNTAAYSGVIGRGWLAEGGTYVLANIRGGGEYGPRWHRAGLRENRHRVYEDFEAVATALLDGGVTTPAQLGIWGGSNGGLLVGNMYVRTPELFGAVVCQVPLLDMKRYSHLLAGASWMAEYGDPDDPADWAYLQTYSPYHLIDAERRYPPMLLMTSTRDDRVHPGHARKMAAALVAAGHDVTYWENVEGGHGGAADAPQQATMAALAYTFLHRHLAGG